eukprot:1742493-Prorocentrum_lima.AAC.1
MTSSLVGSEMCIRDRNMSTPSILALVAPCSLYGRVRHNNGQFNRNQQLPCLLYTSDAADDM